MVGPVDKERRDVDELVERPAADVEVEFGGHVPAIPQARRDLDEMFALKKHGRRIVDGLLIIEEVELRGMNGKAAGA